MHITMVKKRLASGEDCRKCIEAEALLKRRGLWGRIDSIVIAEETDPESEGMRLSREHGVDIAPFIIVRGPDRPKIFKSVLAFASELSGTGTPESVEARESAREQNADALSPNAIADAAQSLAGAHPSEILRFGLSRYGAESGIAFSGAEDVALIDMASKLGLSFSVFCLDTGRLHAETYQLIERVRKHYGVEVQMFSPDPVVLEPFIRKKGLFSFYEDGHKECCQVRKVAPLKRALGGYAAWVTGQRKDQSPATRAEIPVVQVDDTFQGKRELLLKLNPLANWSSAQVWQYIRANDVPFNKLHERGFISIGCEPCTRPVVPGEHERAGRWWWEEQTARECGLHAGNVK